MKISCIKESCLYVKDISQTTEFYKGVLGLSVISKVDGRHVFFRVGKGVLLCFIPEATKAEKVLPPHFSKGPHHIAFEVPLQEYYHWKTALTNAGIEITHEQLWSKGHRSFYFEDPDANVLEIVQPGMWD